MRSLFFVLWALFLLNGAEAADIVTRAYTTIAEPVIAAFEKGHQVAYFGHDSNGREVRYLGVVTPDKTVNIYLESQSRSQAELESIFDGLLKGLVL